MLGQMVSEIKKNAFSCLFIFHRARLFSFEKFFPPAFEAKEDGGINSFAENISDS
jgi:hypothetical protein